MLLSLGASLNYICVCATDENLIKCGIIIVSRCDHCCIDAETVNHLFLTCHFATQLWQWLGGVGLIIKDLGLVLLVAGLQGLATSSEGREIRER